MILIDGHSRVKVGSCRINCLLFLNDLVLLASSEQGVQHVLDRFSAACNQAGMKISAKKRDVMYLQKPRAGYAASSQYLGVMVFTSDGRWNKEIDTRIGEANVFLRMGRGAWRHKTVLDFEIGIFLLPFQWKNVFS